MYHVQLYLYTLYSVHSLLFSILVSLSCRFLSVTSFPSDSWGAVTSELSDAGSIQFDVMSSIVWEPVTLLPSSPGLSWKIDLNETNLVKYGFKLKKQNNATRLQPVGKQTSSIQHLRPTLSQSVWLCHLVCKDDIKYCLKTGCLPLSSFWIFTRFFYFIEENGENDS